MRDRLKRLIKKEVPRPKADALVNSILADGWIRPPCKVGDVLWIPSVYSNKVYSKVIKEILIHEKDGEIGKYVYASSAYFPFENIGKTVFLTKEEAEAKLKEREVMSICKDCFHSYVCEQFNEHREWDNKKCHFANDHFASVADVVKVVRCKDCEHYHKGKESTVCDYDYCDILYYCDGSHRTACEEDFCSYGKLKEREKV